MTHRPDDSIDTSPLWIARSLRSLLVLCALFGGELLAQPVPTTTGLPAGKPAELGLDPESLAQVRPALEKFIAESEFSGAVVAVAYRGHQVLLETVGYADLESKWPIAPNSIFRIYSMSKPVTSVGVLALVEDGKIDLDAPIEHYLTEFEKVQVYTGTTDDGFSVVAPVRSITVRDLLRHTSGLTYGFFGNTAVDRAYRERAVLDPEKTLEESVATLTEIPLLHQPGSRFHYGVSTDVCGYLIEKVSGQTLAEFFQERIFDPLEMRDTGFSVPESKKTRLATNYSMTINGLQPNDPRDTSSFLEQPALLSGGGGLVSTARDYLRFCEMLRGRGRLGNVEILRPETVEAMTSNQLTGPCYPVRIGIPFRGVGFGLGVSVIVERRGPTNPVGEFGWAGAASTDFWVSPADELSVVVLVQRMPFTNRASDRVRPLIYGALPRMQKPAAAPK